MLPQAPSAPEPFLAVEQAWQLPVQAVLQQTPSAAKVLVHSLPPPAATPLAFLGRHEPPPQYCEARHCPSLVHPTHAPPEQSWGAQLTGSPGTQVPLPSQRGAGVRTTPLQVATPQVVPLG